MIHTLNKFITWFQLIILKRKYYVGVDFADGIRTSCYGYKKSNGKVILTKIQQKKLVIKK